MVRKNLQKQIDETIRMELEDVPHQHVKNWCEHIQIKQENVSLVWSEPLKLDTMG